MRWLGLGLGLGLEGSFFGGRGLLLGFRVLLGRDRACGEKRMGIVDAIVVAGSDEEQPVFFQIEKRERERGFWLGKLQ